MRSRLGFGIILMAAAALVLTEAQSFAGRHRGCSSCASPCSNCTASAPADQASAPAPKEDAQASASANAAQPSTSVASAPTVKYRNRGAGRRAYRR